MAAIELKTAPSDFRFPTTNQTRHCFTRYIEYHRCVNVKGDGAADCEKFAKYYRSLCVGKARRLKFSSPDPAQCGKPTALGTPLPLSLPRRMGGEVERAEGERNFCGAPLNLV